MTSVLGHRTAEIYIWLCVCVCVRINWCNILIYFDPRLLVKTTENTTQLLNYSMPPISVGVKSMNRELEFIAL